MCHLSENTLKRSFMMIDSENMELQEEAGTYLVYIFNQTHTC